MNSNASVCLSEKLDSDSGGKRRTGEETEDAVVFSGETQRGAGLQGNAARHRKTR